jgi:hypothetical protein
LGAWWGSRGFGVGSWVDGLGTNCDRPESVWPGPGSVWQTPHSVALRRGVGCLLRGRELTPHADSQGVDWGLCTTWARADGTIATVAGRQRALITRAQLIELGLGRRAIDHAISRGRLHVMHRGVYALVQPPALPPLAREHAATSPAAIEHSSVTTPRRQSGASVLSSMKTLTSRSSTQIAGAHARASTSTEPRPSTDATRRAIRTSQSPPPPAPSWTSRPTPPPAPWNGRSTRP